MNEIGKEFEELVKIVSRLRHPDGCPWDRDQTSQSLIPFLIEETYELIESIDEENWETVKEELGDVMLHIVFQASIAEDNQQFKLEEVLKTVNEKLVKRHQNEPLFSSIKLLTEDGILVSIEGKKLIDNSEIFKRMNLPSPIRWVMNKSGIDPYYSRFKSNVELSENGNYLGNGFGILEIMDLK